MSNYGSHLVPVHNAFNERGYFPAKPIANYAIGLDLGSAMDHTAISVVCHRRDPLPEGSEGWLGADSRPTARPVALSRRTSGTAPAGAVMSR